MAKQVKVMSPEALRQRLTPPALESLREAVRHQLRCWNSQRDLETVTGATIDGMGALIDELASGLSRVDEVNAETLPDEMLRKELLELDAFDERTGRGR